MIAVPVVCRERPGEVHGDRHVPVKPADEKTGRADPRG